MYASISIQSLEGSNMVGQEEGVWVVKYGGMRVTPDVSIRFPEYVYKMRTIMRQSNVNPWRKAVTN